jgi:hypothetical protein
LIQVESPADIGWIATAMARWLVCSNDRIGGSPGYNC